MKRLILKVSTYYCSSWHGGCSSTAIDPVDLSSLRLAPGKGCDVSIAEMTHQITVNFGVQYMKDRAPVPQDARTY
jgi:hypothetical protein